MHTDECKRRTLQRNDVAVAIGRSDTFDFLIDIVPREDAKLKKAEVRMRSTRQRLIYSLMAALWAILETFFTAILPRASLLLSRHRLRYAHISLIKLAI